MKNYPLILVLLIFVMSACGNPAPEFGQWKKAADNLAFPEGPAWHDNGTLYYSNCHGGWIGYIKGATADTFLVADSVSFIRTNGMTVGKDGNIYACEYGIGKIIRITPEGKISDLVTEYEGKSFNRPNDLAFDKNGNLWFTDPKGYGEDVYDGRVFCYDFGAGRAILTADSLSFPNGIAFSPDDGDLFVCESGRARILRFEVSPGGKLSQKTEFIKLPGGDPDGIAFDIFGNLYAAHYDGKAIYVISPFGEILRKVETPGKNPSNLEFAGEDLKTLYITEDETNSVYFTDVTIPGVKLFGGPAN